MTPAYGVDRLANRRYDVTSYALPPPRRTHARARTSSTGVARRARRRHAPADTGGAEVLIRSAATADEAAIDRLSELDDQALPHGERLIGELEGRVVAAVDVDSGEAVADPFVATAALVELPRAARRAGAPMIVSIDDN